MTNVTLYGKPSSNYEYLKMRVLDVAKDAGLDIKLKEISDIGVFIKRSIYQIPAVEINDELILNTFDIHSYIQQVNQALLKKEGYGNLVKLIVATDFSESSDNAINYSYQLSKYLKSVIKLLHVYRPRVIHHIPDDVSEYMIENTAREQLNSAKGRLLELNLSLCTVDTPIESNFRNGMAVEEILSFSEDQDKSILIMGSNGSTGSLLTILGSVSMSVVSKSDRPVLIVPPYAKFREIKKIAYCTEDLKVDNSIIEEMRGVLTAFNSEIHLIHIKEDDHDINKEEVIKLWRDKYPNHNIILNVIEHKDKLVAINDYCADNDIDLLSLTRQDHGFFKNIFHKSFTKRILINTEIPLFILSQK